MSLEVLRQVRQANERHGEEDARIEAELGRISPEVPGAPIGASGGAMDTTTRTPGQ